MDVDDAPVPGKASVAENVTDNVLSRASGDAADDTEYPQEETYNSERDDNEEEDGEEDEEEDEGEEEEDEYETGDGGDLDDEDGFPEENDMEGSDANATPEGGRKIVITVGSRTYAPSAFIDNVGLHIALGTLKSNPKTTFSACSEMHAHNVLQCRALHHTSRGVLVGDRYVRVNMLVKNPALTALLMRPKDSLTMTFCNEPDGDTHTAESCEKLHLLPDVVFVGIPGLRTAYFGHELHENLALTNLRKLPWETAVGSWCRFARSHVITTCRNIHYKRDGRYTERPKPPMRPAALIPALTPQRPPQEGDNKRSGKYQSARGRGGGRGRGAGRGSGRGRGGRGRNPRATTEHVPLPESLRAPRTAPTAAHASSAAPQGPRTTTTKATATGRADKNTKHTKRTVTEADPLELMDSKLQKYLIAFAVILFALVLVMLGNRRD